MAFGLLHFVAISFTLLGLLALLITLRNSGPKQVQLQEMAWSDALTGLANRRRLDRDVSEFVAGSATGRGRVSPGGPTAVVMVDIDHFKEINDRYGHHFGDEVLREFGAMLSRQVRADDVVYRYGGEEFCILLPGAADTEGAIVANRIVNAARRLELPHDVRITVSAGVADGAGVELDRTLLTADRALFAAKRAGRDQAAGAGSVAEIEYEQRLRASA